MSGLDDYKYSLEDGPNSEIIKAAHMMARSYHDHDMMNGAIDEVNHEFPTIDRDDLITMWIGVNAVNNGIGDMD